jgi:hypothetical protein
MTCPNFKDSNYAKLEAKVGSLMAYKLWYHYDEPTIHNVITEAEARWYKTKQRLIDKFHLKKWPSIPEDLFVEIDSWMRNHTKYQEFYPVYEPWAKKSGYLNLKFKDNKVQSEFKDEEANLKDLGVRFKQWKDSHPPQLDIFTQEVYKIGGSSSLVDELNNARTSRTKMSFDQMIEEARIQLEKLLGVNKKGLKLEEQTKKDLYELLKFFRDPSKLGQLETMTTYFVEVNTILEHYRDRALKASEIDTLSAKIMELLFLKQMANSFKPFIDQLNAEFAGTPRDNKVKELLENMNNSITTIESIYSRDVFQSVVDSLYETTDPVVQNLQKELADEIDYLRKRQDILKQRGDQKRVDKLEKKIEDLQKRKGKIIPTKDLLALTLSGQNGDANFISMWLEATIASGDPIVAGFAKKIKDSFNTIRVNMLPMKNDAQTILDKYSRITGRDKANNAKFFEGLYEVIDVPTHDDDGKITHKKAYSLIGEFSAQFDKDEADFKAKIQTLKDEHKDDEAAAVEKEYEEWLGIWAERRYTNEWYEASKLLTPKAKAAQDELLEQITRITRGPNRNNLSEIELDELEELWGRYKALGSLVYFGTGVRKTGDDLEMALSVRAYRKERAKMRTFELTENGKSNFEIAQKRQKAFLDAGRITQEQYDKWLRRFTSLRIDPEFFKKRQAILDRINAVMSKIPKDLLGSRESVTELWENLISVGNNNRDEDGIIDGGELSENEFYNARYYELKIDQLKEDFLRLSGLTTNQQKELQTLVDIPLEDRTEEQNERITELFNSKAWFKSELAKHVSSAEIKALFGYWESLGQIQTKQPTKYYEERYNFEFEAYFNKIPESIDWSLNEKMEAFKQSNWYKENHITRTRKTKNADESFEMEEYEEPLYIWNHVLPSDESYIQEGYPSIHFQEIVVHDIYKNPNFQELDTNGGYHTPKAIVDNKPSKYLNSNFQELKGKAATGDAVAKVQLEMLEFLTRNYKEGQRKVGVGAALNMKLVIPSIEKDWLSRLQDSNGVGGVGKQIGQYVKRRLTVNEQDKDIILGDLSGIEFRYLPVKYTGNIELDDVSLNLMESIIQFSLMAEQYKTLKEDILPLSEALKDILSADQNKASTGKFDALLRKFGIQRVVRKEGESNRFKQVDEFIRSVLYNETEKQEKWLGKNTTKIIDSLLSASAVQMLALNLPSHAVNLISGEIQSLIEANANKFFTKKTWARAKKIYAANVGEFWKDYQKEGNQSLITQLSYLFDVPQGEAFDKFGAKTDWSKIREGRGWLFMTKNMGEHEIQVSTMIAMLINKKVKMGDQEVSLFEAYELKDGKVQLKEGVEFSNTEFNTLTGRMHSILKDLNGNYNKFDRPLIEKYSMGRMLFFMRKYFVPLMSRRFSPLHVDMEAGTFKEGYYRTFWRIFFNDLKHLQLTIGENWHDLTLEEKQAMHRVIMEAGIILTLMLLLLLLGYYDDDRDISLDEDQGVSSLHFWKLHLMYLTLRAKSEAENFIPAPGLGFNELYNQGTTFTLSWRYLGNLMQITEQLGYLLTGNDKAIYDRRQGIWEKGDWKLWAKMGKVFGFTGNTLHPDVMLKNLENAQRVK